MDSDRRWQKASAQYNKALAALSERPPDLENAVKDAVGAIEGCLRVATNRLSEPIDRLIDRDPFATALHSQVRQTIKNLYNFRGDAAGVAHGDAGGHAVSSEEAEFVVAVAGAACSLISANAPTEAERPNLW